MSWMKILGHDDWIDAFRAVHRRGRLAHAYLFVGPDGVGKRTFALELGKALLCENPPAEPGLTACDQCSSCHLVDANTHPDLFQVSKPEDKNEFPIDTMRDFFDKYSLKSARGRGKVAVVDGVDDFNDATANCSLKTLEEPPPGALLILVGTSLDMQLPTIRSRCQPVRFAPLTPATVRTILERELLDEPSLLPRLVRTSEGSPGLARQLSDPEIWTFRDRLLSGLSQPRFDSVTLGKAFVEFVEDAGKETVLHRRRARLTLKLVTTAVRDAIRVEAGEPAASFLAEDAQLIQALADRAAPEKWLAVLDRCLEAEVQLDRYIQVGLVLEALLDAIGQRLDG